MPNIFSSFQKTKWDLLAKKKANYYIYSDIEDQTDQKNYQKTGKSDVKELILQDKYLSRKINFSQSAILEIGAGNGRMTEFISPHFKKVYAMDISPTMLWLAQKRLSKLNNISYIDTAGDTYPLKDESLEVVFSWMVFHHFATKKMVTDNLQEILRVLKPGGVAKIQFRGKPAHGGYLNRLKWFYGVYFSDQELTRILTHLGFNNIKLSRPNPKIIIATFQKPKKSSKNLSKNYQQFADKIHSKRFNSTHAQRKYVHRQNYRSFTKHIKPNMLVADVGAGEGTLSILMAQKGAQVIAFEISTPNLKAAQKNIDQAGLVDKIHLVQADAQQIPALNKKFDLVVSCHVLEHLQDFDQGLLELKRITKNRVLFGVPTCLNWCAIPLLGGGNYWNLSYLTPWHLLKGTARLFFSFGTEGVNEDYAGQPFPHIWRYPWAVFGRISRAKLYPKSIQAPTIVPPYLLTYMPFLLPLYRTIDSFTSAPLLKHLGYGTTYLVAKRK